MLVTGERVQGGEAPEVTMVHIESGVNSEDGGSRDVGTVVGARVGVARVVGGRVTIPDTDIIIMTADRDTTTNKSRQIHNIKITDYI